jgi:hypothetical protein
MIDEFFARIFVRFCKFQKFSNKERAKKSTKTEKGADVYEGKFVLNIDFIMVLNPTAFAYMKTKQDSI